LSVSGIPKIVIFSIHDDLHAHAVKAEIEGHHDAICEIIETDRLSATDSFSWSNHGSLTGELWSAHQRRVSLEDFDVAWIRRIRLPQHVPDWVTDSSQISVINADCRAALYGILHVGFRGCLVNDPLATTHAENKLVQLEVARRVGIAVPDTLVSQNPVRIREFVNSHNGNVVVKVVQGAVGAPLMAGTPSAAMLEMEESLLLSPAIYQQYIPGTEHLRVHCFGGTIQAATIVSNDLDWRAKYDLFVRPTDLNCELSNLLLKVLADLGLKMAIIDLKLNDEGTPYWLELNSQGQFLFIEALCGMKLTAACAKFLLAEATRSIQGSS
jgi:glutathione synthase/RimK-type ligase-like ATP-grasp enzyme